MPDLGWGVGEPTSGRQIPPLWSLADHTLNPPHSDTPLMIFPDLLASGTTTEQSTAKCSSLTFSFSLEPQAHISKGWQAFSPKYPMDISNPLVSLSTFISGIKHLLYTRLKMVLGPSKWGLNRHTPSPRGQ